MGDENIPLPPSGPWTGNPSSLGGPLPDQVILNNRNRPAFPSQQAPAKTPSQGPGPGDMKDGFREIVETIVFVVVLVLLLKTFLAEAFVIPTGSMATTLLGYHREVTCESCGYRYLVNASSEAEDRIPQYVTQSYCPNCRFLNTLRQQMPEGVFP
jgi:hypothetical protein